MMPFKGFTQYEREFLLYMSGFEEQELIQDMKTRREQSKNLLTGMVIEYKFDFFWEEVQEKK